MNVLPISRGAVFKYLICIPVSIRRLYPFPPIKDEWGTPRRLRHRIQSALTRVSASWPPKVTEECLYVQQLFISLSSPLALLLSSHRLFPSAALSDSLFIRKCDSFEEADGGPLCGGEAALVALMDGGPRGRWQRWHCEQIKPPEVSYWDAIQNNSHSIITFFFFFFFFFYSFHVKRGEILTTYWIYEH